MDDAALPPEPPSEDGGNAGRILDEPLTEALSRRYLAYALSPSPSGRCPTCATA